MRPGVQVKLLPKEDELYVFAESRDRIHKERAMRRRKLKALVKRLKQLQQMKFNDTRQLLLKLGEAKGRYRAAWRLIEVVLPQAEASGAATEPTLAQPIFSFRLNRKKLQAVRRREGRYLLRTNLCGRDPADLWQFYIQLTEVEAAFKNLKDDLQLRPIYHQLESRIEAHIFILYLPEALHPCNPGSSLSWPIACTSPCERNSSRWRRVSPRAPCSISSPASRCSMFISRPTMVEP